MICGMTMLQNLAPSDLAALSFIAASLFMALAAISKKVLHRKMFGSLLIFALAVLADNAAVFTLAILIIATLIADPEFIENIAAIVFRRKAAWSFRKASAEEIRQKQQREADALSQAGKNMAVPSDRNALLRQIQDFEAGALQALSQCGLFDHVVPQISVASGQDVFVADAVAKRDEREFIVEARCGRNSLALNAAALDLQNFLDTYRFLHPTRKARGLLVMPQDLRLVGAQEYLGRDIGLLKYDAGARRFVNQDEFSAWMGQGGAA